MKKNCFLFLFFLAAMPTFGMRNLQKEADLVFAGLLFAGVGFCRYKANILREEFAKKKEKTVKEHRDFDDSIRDYRQIAWVCGGFGFFLCAKTMYNEIKKRN